MNQSVLVSHYSIHRTELLARIAIECSNVDVATRSFDFESGVLFPIRITSTTRLAYVGIPHPSIGVIECHIAVTRNEPTELSLGFSV